MGLPAVAFFGLLALIPLEVKRSNGRNLHDWFDQPDPQHTCQISAYNESIFFGAMLKDCHCKSNCYGAIVPCNMIRPALEMEPTLTSPNLNYGLGTYCCDKGNCNNKGALYACDIVVGNVSTLSWTWTLDLHDEGYQWQEEYYCFQGDLLCHNRARQKHFMGRQHKCWILHWKQGQVTLSYQGPLAGTIGVFWLLIGLCALYLFCIVFVVLVKGSFYLIRCLSGSVGLSSSTSEINLDDFRNTKKELNGA